MPTERLQSALSSSAAPCGACEWSLCMSPREAAALHTRRALQGDAIGWLVLAGNARRADPAALLPDSDIVSQPAPRSLQFTVALPISLLTYERVPGFVAASSIDHLRLGMPELRRLETPLSPEAQAYGDDVQLWF